MEIDITLIFIWFLCFGGDYIAQMHHQQQKQQKTNEERGETHSQIKMNDYQQRANCALLLLFGEGASKLCSNKCVKHICIGMDSCTHLGMSLHCTLWGRGQQGDRSIPVQFRTITHCLRAFHHEVITSSNNNNSKITKKNERKRSHEEMDNLFYYCCSAIASNKANESSELSTDLCKSD